MKLPCVSVLMSTYNGERYIKEQIDSILSQKDVDIHLLIRDDGSKDRTPLICKEYMDKYSNINFYQGENVGVGKSFMELLEMAPKAEYYSFADQDDVWLKDKLIQAIRSIKSIKEIQDKPVLYTSNQILVNEKLNPYGLRFQKEPRHDLIQEVASNSLSGCTMVMDLSLKNIISDKKYKPEDYFLNTRLHDTWFLIVANIVGEIIYDEKSYILYRQHENNVVGVKKKTTFQKIFDKYNRFITGKYRGNRSRTAMFLQEKFNMKLSIEQKDELKYFIECKSIKGALKILKNKKVKDVFDETGFFLFFRCILGWV